MINLREKKDYTSMRLGKKDFLPSPFAQFSLWYQDAVDRGELEPNAMQLATLRRGIPSVRTVLAKDFDERGITFFTNYKSRKALDLEDNNRVAAVFLWKTVSRQITLEGKAFKLSKEESAIYFHSRSRASQLAAYTSKQGEELPSFDHLLNSYRENEKRWKNSEIPAPLFWGGFIIVPDRIEFWQGHTNRLHDRLNYCLTKNKRWNLQRLSP